jgi:death-on-curing family protein
MENQIEIYTSPDGSTEIEVHFVGDTFWLNLNEISTLFEKDKSVISRHLRNIYNEGELDRISTVAKNATVQLEAKREILREIDFYNLDAILSVGYRVNSKRGTQFRQWATKRLKDFLIKGIAINEKRLEQQNKEIEVLHDGIRILSRAIEEKALTSTGYEWLHRFSVGLQLLDDFDHEKLDSIGNHKENIAYPSIEEKAAMLLYLIAKNHAFVDGNKRIAAACFLLFLDKNELLFTSLNHSIISNEALASLTLFVASSKAEEMETVKKLLISVLNRKAKY